MQGSPKRNLPAEKIARGTYRDDRDDGIAEVVVPDALPTSPDWLTTEGEEIWQDDIGRIAAVRLVSEEDSTVFATYCNLMGAIIKCWRAGEVPPAAHLTEARKMAEQFGLFGRKSRLIAGGPDDGKNNPFARNGKRGRK